MENTIKVPPPRIVVFGVEGSGKRTQLKHLSNKYGLPIVSIRRILDNNQTGRTSEPDAIEGDTTKEGDSLHDASSVGSSLIQEALAASTYSGCIIEGDSSVADLTSILIATNLHPTVAINLNVNSSHFKMPNDGVGFPWHQDIQHRDKKPGDWENLNGKGSYVQTLTCLDDMSRDNGPVMFIPYSGKKGKLDFKGAADYSDTEYEEFPKKKNEHFDESKAVAVEAFHRLGRLAAEIQLGVHIIFNQRHLVAV